VDDLKPLLRLKKKIEHVKTEQAKNKGRLEQEMEALKKFNCTTLDDAKKLLNKSEIRRKKLLASVRKKEAKFDQDHPDV